MNTDVCPHCASDQRGPEIPAESREHYGDATHFYRTMMVEIPEVYDGGLYFMCPDCGGTWHRWPVGHYLHQRAQVYIDA